MTTTTSSSVATPSRARKPRAQKADPVTSVVAEETAAEGSREPAATEQDNADADTSGEPVPMQPARPGRPNGSTGISKSDKVLKLLRSRHGATVPAIMEATTWQAHTVRGFLSGTIKKRLKLDLTSEVGKDGVRRYKVASAHAS